MNCHGRGAVMGWEMSWEGSCHGMGAVMGGELSWDWSCHGRGAVMGGELSWEGSFKIRYEYRPASSQEISTEFQSPNQKQSGNTTMQYGKFSPV